MRFTEEMAFINPRPPYFPMETRQLLEGYCLSPEQEKAIALLKVTYIKKFSLLEIEFLDEFMKVLKTPVRKV